ELAPRSGPRLRGEEPRDPGAAHAVKVHLDRLLELGEGQSGQGIERADIGRQARRSSPQHRSMPANGFEARYEIDGGRPATPKEMRPATVAGRISSLAISQLPRLRRRCQDPAGVCFDLR